MLYEKNITITFLKSIFATFLNVLQASILTYASLRLLSKSGHGQVLYVTR